MPKKKKKDEPEENQVLRVPLPKGQQVIGIVVDKMGGGKYKVYCTDEKERVCRIPGAKRRFMWIEVDSVAIVEPWSGQEDERGDIVLNYSKAQVNWLKKNGKIDPLTGFLKR